MKENLKIDKEMLKNLKLKIKADKKLLVIISIGILGMIFLAFTDLLSADDKGKTEMKSVGAVQTYEQNYKEQIENDLKKLISSIDGAGKTKVMVTLDSGTKSIYAIDEAFDESNDISTNGENSDERYKHNSKKEYIIVKNSENDETGMVIEVMQPQIRGVAVVCEGANSAVVKQNITDTITAVLNISSTRVSITKMSN
ncbi:MAG: hypothetical protein LBH71_02655 [Oscillospiraceae bacterium]|jgi:stage III sporulation protein AG|nr:hypothetical protein [Oscillospiraceae bacterium]